MLDDDECRQVFSRNEGPNGLNAVLAEYEHLTGYRETNPAAIYHHVLSQYGPPCRYCGKPLRTPRANFCGSCMTPVADDTNCSDSATAGEMPPSSVRHGFEPVVMDIKVPEMDGQSDAVLRVYKAGAWITGILTFIVCWIYAISAYGFLLGVGLGWLPSGIVAVIAAYLWPLLLIGIILLVYAFSK